MPLRGSQLAFYLKKRNPELYEKAKRIKEEYNLTWDVAIAIARGESPLPVPSKVEEIIKVLEELKARVEFIEEFLKRFEGLEREISESLNRRFREDLGYTCKHMDKDGYCTFWYWYKKEEGLLMKEGVKEGRKVYYVNVWKHRWICALCPTYAPKRVEA